MTDTTVRCLCCGTPDLARHYPGCLGLAVPPEAAGWVLALGQRFVLGEGILAPQPGASQEELAVEPEPNLDGNFDLNAILQRDYMQERVVSFWLNEEKTAFGIGEMCDECFGTELTPLELDRLIAWLTRRRAEMR